MSRKKKKSVYTKLRKGFTLSKAKRLKIAAHNAFSNTRNKLIAYGNARKIYNYLKKDQSLSDIKFNYDDVNNALLELPAFVDTRKKHYRIKTLRIIPVGLHYSISCDLFFFPRMKSKNDDYSVFLIVVRDFDRQTFVRPVKGKAAIHIVPAMLDIINKELYMPPKILFSDDGKEFTSSRFSQEVIAKHDIKHVILKSQQKAVIAETSIRLLKQIISTFISLNRSYRFIDNLQDLVDLLNSKPRSSMNNLAPNDIDMHNELQVIKKVYMPIVKQQLAKNKPKTDLVIGDVVRLRKGKVAFSKQMDDALFKRYFRIAKIYKTRPVSFKLRGFSLKSIPVTTGRVYRSQLQKVVWKDGNYDDLEETYEEGGKTYGLFYSDPNVPYQIDKDEVINFEEQNNSN